jgi:hypothetical protein
MRMLHLGGPIIVAAVFVGSCGADLSNCVTPEEKQRHLGCVQADAGECAGCDLAIVCASDGRRYSDFCSYYGLAPVGTCETGC